MSRGLRVLFRVGSLTGLTDRQLLERFQSGCLAGDHDLAEAALTALADRHSGMVWNVCRSLIRDHHDVEDAVQATFLILVRKAGTLRVRETLGPWLHVVACRTASSVRAARSRRRQVEYSVAETLREVADPSGPTATADVGDELRAAIHAEIWDLPEAFRTVVVLCDLEGLSYLEAAERLKIPLGTVQSRLSRARRRLRRGLARRGIHSSDVSLVSDASDAPLLGPIAAGGPPASLAARVGRLGALVAADPGCLRTAVAGSVQALTEGGLRSMYLGNLGRVLVASAGVAVFGGTLWYADARSGQAGSTSVPPVVQQAGPKSEVKDRVEVPAPRQLKVSSGRGKIKVYALDETGKRIPVRPESPKGPFRATERDARWTIITGSIEHHRVQEALEGAHPKPLPAADRLYCRVELMRQALRQDGAWSAWMTVDMLANCDILDQAPEVEKERVDTAYIVPGLVDPLPLLTVGFWRGADLEELLPPPMDRREGRLVARKPALTTRGDRPADLMVRTLDFTVDPGHTYRYRARVVLFNPRYRENPGERKFIFGPWSEATGIVTIPSP